MRARTYSAILLVLMLAGLLQFASQRRAISDLRERISRKAVLARGENKQAVRHASLVTNSSSPSPEVLRLRNEVTMLMKELNAATAPTLMSKKEAENDWALVHSGAKPSQLSG